MRSKGAEHGLDEVVGLQHGSFAKVHVDHIQNPSGDKSQEADQEVADVQATQCLDFILQQRCTSRQLGCTSSKLQYSPAVVCLQVHAWQKEGILLVCGPFFVKAMAQLHCFHRFWTSQQENLTAHRLYKQFHLKAEVQQVGQGQCCQSKEAQQHCNSGHTLPRKLHQVEQVETQQNPCTYRGFDYALCCQLKQTCRQSAGSGC